MPTDIKQRLAETIAWCTAHADPTRAGSTTRSSALAVPLFHQSKQAILDSLLASPLAAREAVDLIAERRRVALARERLFPQTRPGDLAGGRVFATDFDTDICCAATEPSNGFVDDFDIPGWDTWFAHDDTGKHGGVVYGWVPPALLELADRGFDAIPVNCIWWVEDRVAKSLLESPVA